jgi:hypothetical protein
MRMETIGMGINLAILGENEGDPGMNIARDAVGGFLQGGIVGGFLNLGIGVLDWLFGGNQGNTFT